MSMTLRAGSSSICRATAKRARATTRMKVTPSSDSRRWRVRVLTRITFATDRTPRVAVGEQGGDDLLHDPADPVGFARFPGRIAAHRPLLTVGSRAGAPHAAARGTRARLFRRASSPGPGSPSTHCPITKQPACQLDELDFSGATGRHAPARVAFCPGPDGVLVGFGALHPATRRNGWRLPERHLRGGSGPSMFQDSP